MQSSRSARVSVRPSTKMQRREAYIGVVKNWSEDPVEHNESDKHVHLCPPGNDERTSDISDLRPVKSDDAHPEP